MNVTGASYLFEVEHTFRPSSVPRQNFKGELFLKSLIILTPKLIVALP
jgi:hypothetical protein